MNWKQKKEVIRDTNEIALVLLEFYYGKLGIKNYTYSDISVSAGLDWSLKKVANNRRLLEKSGYFYKKIIRGRDDTSTIIELGHKRWSK